MCELHPFERAGLGLAPFRLSYVEERRGPIRTQIEPGIFVEVGAPGQPMGTCDYCGQGIAICCGIESADGRRFIVGSDCVAKLERESNRADTATDALIREVKRNVRSLQIARESKRIEAAKLAIGNKAEALAAQPHPKAAGLTLLDYVRFLFANGGHSGQLRAARYVEAY